MSELPKWTTFSWLYRELDMFNPGHSDNYTFSWKKNAQSLSGFNNLVPSIIPTSLLCLESWLIYDMWSSLIGSRFAKILDCGLTCPDSQLGHLEGSKFVLFLMYWNGATCISPYSGTISSCCKESVELSI